MKVSINSKFISGPYGGGVKFANYLKDFLEKKSIKVVNHLGDRDIDLILHVNPFPFLMKAASYSFLDAYFYKLRYPNTIIILRVNECDERKRTHYMNRLLVKASCYSDYLVFIASWLKPLLQKCGLTREKPSRVILNGADQEIFNTENKQYWDKRSRLKLVTHHWSGNYLKGHDVYQKLDRLLNKQEFRDKFSFTYIGNHPKNLIYKNARVIKPLSGKRLAEELREHHVYITASRNEPGGMHHIEGALCGLPLLYVDSGALPEYCQGYGIKFNPDNLEEKLLQMYRDYDHWVDRIRIYNRTAKRMADNYYRMFLEIYKSKNRFKLTKRGKLDFLLAYLSLKIYSAYYLSFWKMFKKFR